MDDLPIEIQNMMIVADQVRDGCTAGNVGFALGSRDRGSQEQVVF